MRSRYSDYCEEKMAQARELKFYFKIYFVPLFITMIAAP
jgi:hypothetical protein